MRAWLNNPYTRWGTILFVGLCVLVCVYGFEALYQTKISAAYTISNSTRFVSGNTAYLKRTPTVAGNQKTWTFSAWVKRSALGTDQTIFSAYGANTDAGYTALRFNTSDQLVFAGGATAWRVSNAVFRDPAAWYHIVLAVDTTQGAGQNLARIYVNNVEVTSWATNNLLTQNADYAVDSAVAHYIGISDSGTGSTRPLDAYVSDAYLIDGQQLDPSSFGAYDSSGYWRPKLYSGAYGTNGFHLALTTSSPGTDTSGNTNTFTATNIASTDNVADSPTNSFATYNAVAQGASGLSKGNLTASGAATSSMLMTSGAWYWEVTANTTGVSAGVVEQDGSVGSTTPVASGTTVSFMYDADNGVLYVSNNGGSSYTLTSSVPGPVYAYATGGASTANFGQGGASGLTYYAGSGGYFKYQPTTIAVGGNGSQTFSSSGTFTVPNNYTSIVVTVTAAGGGGGGGCGNSAEINTGGTGATGGKSSFNSSVSANGGGGGKGSTNTDSGQGAGGAKGIASGGDTNTTGGGSAGGAGGVCGNGTGFTGGAGGAGGKSVKTYTSGLTSGASIAVVVGTGGAGGAGMVIGGTAGKVGGKGSVSITWSASVSGTVPSYKALSTANLPAPAIAVPKNYFDAVAYSGTGAAQSIVQSGISGIVTGFTPDLIWLKDRSATNSNGLFDSIRAVKNALFSDSNAAEANLPASLTSLLPNGFALGTDNTFNASGDSYISWLWKSSPATDGVDIVAYSGDNTANRNITHDLSGTPDLVVVKRRDAPFDAVVWSSSLGNSTSYLTLDSNWAAVSINSPWGTGNFSSSQFMVSNTSGSTNANASNSSYIAYLFKDIDGFSNFGIYTGNGSTGGPFVYTGFKPRYVLFKRVDSAGSSWQVFDTARSALNPALSATSPDSSGAETNFAGGIDILSNGFKVRDTNSALNASGGQYIYAAFADVPFKYSAAPSSAGSASTADFLLGMTF